jgi:SPP1 family predicted phage head-tail adaptor
VIGSLSRRIGLERPDRVEDLGGGGSIVWTLVDVVWAGFRSAGRGERVVADALSPRVSQALRIRWRDDIRPGWRVTLYGKPLRVLAVVDRDGRRRWLHLECEEQL